MEKNLTTIFTFSKFTKLENLFKPTNKKLPKRSTNVAPMMKQVFVVNYIYNVQSGPKYI